MIFVVPCRFNPAHPTILDCVQSIRKYHPDDSIVVVDSNSPDKSYFDKIRHIDNLSIEDCQNVNYVHGAFWKVANRHESDHYYVLHDSMVLKANISFMKEKEIGSTRYFRSWNGVGGMVHNVNLYGPPTSRGLYRYGCDNLKQKEWMHNFYNPKKMFFNGLFGCSFIANKDVVGFMKKNNIDKILASNKNEMMAMERLLGAFFTDNNLKFWENCLLGEHHEKPFENQYIKKILLDRQ
tara:strand:- start:70 stop:780 length:711 start_codon:yes stop_codon:yes gene_type:complete